MTGRRSMERRTPPRFEQDGDEGAAFETSFSEPDIKYIEHREESFIRIGCAAHDLAFQPSARPNFFATFQEGEGQMILGGKMIVETRVGQPDVASTASIPTRLIPCVAKS